LQKIAPHNESEKTSIQQSQSFPGFFPDVKPE
jgi:hypothetical protein